MLRAGARHPDADERTPSGSAVTAVTNAVTNQTDIEALHATLNEYLLLEHKFQPRLCLPDDSELQKGEVTVGARDGAVHVLRCLKVWFDLPAAVVIHAVKSVGQVTNHIWNNTYINLQQVIKKYQR
ncbi:hypothetical protein ACJJTC_002743 [Scirpophaga incertulas]